MELVARRAVEGFLSGLHPSPYFGSSVEYADHRPYSLGDELRTIDWKLLAKTDKYYVKLFEEETNTRATIVLDTSRSMSFASEGQMSKLEYGMFLTAALAYLMLHQKDAVGLALFDHGVRQYLPPRATAAHFQNMLGVMEQTSRGRRHADRAGAQRIDPADSQAGDRDRDQRLVGRHPRDHRRPGPLQASAARSDRVSSDGSGRAQLPLRKADAVQGSGRGRQPGGQSASDQAGLFAAARPSISTRSAGSAWSGISATN